MDSKTYLKIAEWTHFYGKWASRFKKPEEKLAIEVANYLNTEHPDLLWWHTQNEGRRGITQQVLSKLVGIRAGVPDIFIPYPILDCCIGGYCAGELGFFCELKAVYEKPVISKRTGLSRIKEVKNKPSKRQKGIMERLSSLGYYVCTAYSLEEFKTHLKGYMEESNNGD